MIVVRPATWLSALRSAQDLFWRITLRSPEPRGRNDAWLTERLGGAMRARGIDALVTVLDFSWAAQRIAEWTGCDVTPVRLAPLCYRIEVSREVPSREIGAIADAFSSLAVLGSEVVIVLADRREAA